MSETKLLTHRFLMQLDVFFQRIDECGGWPPAAKSVCFRHTCNNERPCYFSTTQNHGDEWNTMICTADDYYLWKLSPEAKNKLRSAVIREISQGVLQMDKTK